MKPLLIVLDLDETLIHATTREDIGRAPDFYIEEWKVFVRPHLEPFLEYCFENFKIGVWTSAGSDYAAAVVRGIMPDRELEFVWSSDRCTQSYHAEKFGQKDIRKLSKKGYAKERILAIDDTPEKWARSYGNYVQVTEFRGSSEDSELQRLFSYLPQLADCENVRKVEKRFWRENFSS